VPRAVAAAIEHVGLGDKARTKLRTLSGGMLRRAGTRAGLGKVIPHAFRHGFATAVLDASGGNLVIARDAGGWASATVVSETYAHADVHDPAFDAALRRVWGQQR